jgi:hypothetical protein
MRKCKAQHNKQNKSHKTKITSAKTTIIMPTATRARRATSASAAMPKKNGKQAVAKTATEKCGKPDAVAKVAAAVDPTKKSDSSQYIAVLNVLSKANEPKTGKVCKGKCYTMLLIAVLLVFLTPLVSILACYKEFEEQLTALQTNAKFMNDQMKTMSSELNKTQMHLTKEKAQSNLFFEEAKSVGEDFGLLLIDFDEQAAAKKILEEKLEKLEEKLPATVKEDKEKGKAKKLQAIVQKLQFDLEEALKSPPNVKAVFSPGSPEAKFVSKSPLVQFSNGRPTAFSPEGQEMPKFDDAGSETDSDVEDDFDFDTQPQQPWASY